MSKIFKPTPEQRLAMKELAKARGTDVALRGQLQPPKSDQPKSKNSPTAK